MPAGFALSQHVVGAVVAAFGLLCGCYAVCASVMRRGVGVRFTSLSVALSAVALLGSIFLAGGFGGSAEHPVDKRADATTSRPEGRKADGAPADNAVPGETPKETPLEALVKKLNSGSADERSTAADALGKMGTDAKPAARALCKAATDPSEDVSGKAFNALRSSSQNWSNRSSRWYATTTIGTAHRRPSRLARWVSVACPRSLR